ncbi:hypothetical protein PENARI_c016G09870 [Penicillium arizonense]|uniref:Uncharacterized protein n=1 Tax=Penicillium arizonense TaxID=1835702 RepID=A0A1F5LC10_PENAI|nr:hypothetical protein PENARI_c016G09870 [Penicillium arizonense]OGE50725.1 hypothetical protein PENARI_c016G09870 [Penicillium arizonense]
MSDPRSPSGDEGTASVDRNQNKQGYTCRVCGAKLSPPKRRSNVTYATKVLIGRMCINATFEPFMTPTKHPNEKDGRSPANDAFATN